MPITHATFLIGCLALAGAPPFAGFWSKDTIIASVHSKVESLEQIKLKLTELDAEFLAEQLQKDYYLDDADGSLTRSDRCLRLRLAYTGKSEKIILTYKGPKQKDDFKKRQQIETEVKDADSTEKLLSALGYEKKLAVEKKRQIWQLGPCQVALDEVPMLESFVEIEGPNAETIAEAQSKLGLAELPHIQKSYASLVQEKTSEQSRDQNL